VKILILGVNGFIGHALLRRILQHTSWEVAGLDVGDDRVCALAGSPRFRFVRADIRKHRRRIEQLVADADVVIPLAAFTRPADYVRDPLATFELDFEENLRTVRAAVRTDTRVLFPSTSEVYGLCEDERFNEETSRLVVGPIAKERWMYSCSKQLLDRVIWAYGRRGLRFTIFRPFNWFGPNLDDVRQSAPGSARVVTQFIGHLMRREPIPLVDGGRQRRTFTYVDDGVDALMRIIANEDGRANAAIFNLGNPANDVSIRELAELLIAKLARFPGFAAAAAAARLEEVSAERYYGPAYQDVPRRAPDITAARTQLGWEPRVPLRLGLRRTLAYYAEDASPARAYGTAGSSER